MGFIGDFFHGIGNLLTGHSFGHQDTPTQTQTGTQSPTVIKLPPAAPVETPAPQQGAQGSRPTPASMTPSFLAAAALPNSGAGSPSSSPLESNIGGKSLLGQ